MKNLFIPALTAIAVVTAMTFLALTPEVTVCEAPAVELGEIAGFKSEPLEPSETELEVLPEDTIIIKARYTNSIGDWYLVSAVIGGKSKSSIHRPELCLPAQGFLMTRPHNLEVAGEAWRAIVLDGGATRPTLGFAYSFFNQEGFRTASHLRRIFRDVWDRSFYNRIDRWVMVTVNSSRSDDASLSAFILKLGEVMK